MEELKKHKYIVISGDTGNALGVIRSIAEAGYKPILIYLVEETHLPLLIRCCYLTEVHKVLSYEEGVDYLIETYGSEQNLPFVYTCDDSVESIVDERYEELKDKFYFFNSGSVGRINQMMNKHTISEIAESCGFRSPKQEVVNTGELPKTLDYPVITKTLYSIMGAWKEDSYVCRNKEELLDAYKQIKSPQLLIEEYIDKKNELALEGWSAKNGQYVYIPTAISFLRMGENGYGHYMYCKPLTNETLKKQLEELIRKTSFEGCFEVEFLIDKEDKLWFLEVNFRFSFWNYAVTYGGINYPLCWAESMLSSSQKDLSDFAYVGPLNKYYTALNEAGDFGQSVAHGKISVLQWLKDIHKADMTYLYNPKDKIPAWSFWMHKVLRMVKNKTKYLTKF